LEKSKLSWRGNNTRTDVNPRVKDKRKIFILWKQAYEELFERDYNTIAEEIETYRRNRRKT
jgi:hypothetical protein